MALYFSSNKPVKQRVTRSYTYSEHALMHDHKYNHKSRNDSREMLAEIPKGLRSSGAIEIREKLGTISGGKILDVATQKGGFIETLKKTLKDYSSFVGIDLLEKNIKDARERFKEDPVTFHVMNAENLEYRDSEFDTVCMAHSLHHLTNIEVVLQEMSRVLKPGGHLIIQESYSDGDQTEAQYAEIDTHALDAEIDTILGDPHFKTLTQRRLREIFNGIGLKESEIFESTRYVKCLFCEDAPDCEDPKNEGIVEFALKEMDENLEKITDHSSYHDIKQRAEVIKDRIREHGTAPASVLYYFGTK